MLGRNWLSGRRLNLRVADVLDRSIKTSLALMVVTVHIPSLDGWEEDFKTKRKRR